MTWGTPQPRNVMQHRFQDEIEEQSPPQFTDDTSAAQPTAPPQFRMTGLFGEVPGSETSPFPMFREPKPGHG
jgi:hypothetical protein